MSRTIVAIGEALWDVFPDRRLPGGAPCNVAYHAARLGNRGVIVTRLGSDALGDDLLAFLQKQGIETGFVQRDHQRPTGTVTVTFRHDGDPQFAIAPEVAWDYLADAEEVRHLVRAADAICVGSLAQRGERSRATIQELLSEARGRALVVFDVNLRPPFVDPDVLDATIRAADVVKFGAAELDHLAALFERPALVEWLLTDVGLRAVCVTHGARGASVATTSGTVTLPGIALDRAAGDPVGAGDAFTAALTHGLVREVSPEAALAAANRYAALVASKPGAMPLLSEEELAGVQ